MFRVDDIYDEAKGILGACDDTKFFRWLGDVVTLIANKGDFEGWKGWIDICTMGCKCGSKGHRNDCGDRCITLPREVETILAVNVQGQPTLGLGQLFNFHLNGPGDRDKTCEWSWQDQGNFHVTYRDLITPAQLVVHTGSPDDNDKEFTVFGFDEHGNVLRQQVNGVWRNGLRLPTIYGVALPDKDAPKVARITGLYRAPSVASMRLGTIDDTGTSGVTLGVYEPDEDLPQLRRIIISRACKWVRVAYRKTNPLFTSRWDHIPLKSRIGFLLGVAARKHYSTYDYAGAHAAEADAVRLEVEAQLVAEPPTYSPPQVIDRSQVRDKSDYDIR